MGDVQKTGVLQGLFFFLLLVCLIKNEEGLGRVLRNHWKKEKIKKVLFEDTEFVWEVVWHNKHIYPE